MHLTDEEVIALIDTATQMREQLESKMTKIRACKRECAYRKYHYDKQHSALIAEAIQTPASVTGLQSSNDCGGGDGYLL